MNLKTKQVLAVGLSFGGTIGTVATAILARKAAIKEQQLKSAHGFIESDFNKLEKKQQYLVLAKLYAPTIGVGTMTISSIIGSTVMSRKAQASLMSMAVLADQGWRKYKHQVKSTLGFNTHEELLKGIAKSKIPSTKGIQMDKDENRELFYEDTVGFFKALPEDIAYAYATINEVFNTDYRSQKRDNYDSISIGEFLALANAELVGSSTNKDISENWGWSMEYLGTTQGTTWIYMDILKDKTDDGEYPFKVISWRKEPILLDGDQTPYDILNSIKIEDNFDYLDKKKGVK
ncbi:MAG: DUF6353 family protein [Candidatus Izemoplasmataceae bacterium]